jgi:ferric-dicitrate binding protein FerR (iron transport regulator)
MKNQETERSGRRGWLRTLGVAGVAAAAAPAAAIDPSGGTAGQAPQKEGEAERRKTRYRETPHIRAFYESNRR